MTKKNEATISFVMPCYNDGNSIEKAINSILDQDLPDIEIIVVNDGSTDNSKMVLDNLAASKGIKVIHLEKNEGACVARNLGAKEATGKYLSFLPADAILYPGVARIWYEHLEEFPDHDFLYGGYRFVDETGEPLPNSDYFFQSFEPYLLETSNYIDGSFPIRRSAFWKYAEKMGQPEGLWDKNIKSLQDWDFWLSVVRNGGKGIYMQDIFFGTTPPHPGGLSYDSAENWLARTEAIKKKHNIPIKKLCVASLGAGWHAKRVAYMLGADFLEMPSFKPHRYEAIYVLGFYPEFAAQQDSMFFNNLWKPELGRTPAKKVVHFVGTDIWQLYNLSLRSLKIWQNYFKNNIDVVLCEADFTQAELKELGIDAQIVPIPPVKLFEVKPLPQEFTIAVYQPHVNAEFYRPQEMREIVRAMPQVKFKFFGNPNEVGVDKELKNLEHCGYITDMDKFIQECSAIIRFPLHDGLPLSVLEFILAGRHAVTSVPIKHAYYLNEFTVQDAVKGIVQMMNNAKEVNQTGADFWRAELDHDKYKQTIQKLAGYDPKPYWENRALDWTKQAAAMSIEVPEVKAVFEKTGAKSVLDIGCGDGRWYPYLKEWGMETYKGTDISENLIKAAKMRFPHESDNFVPVRTEDLDQLNWDKVDLIFSYTCFEHIKEEDMPQAIKAVKARGHKLLLVEPINFTSRYYCRSHEYEKHFKVIEKVELKDKVILLCDLDAEV